MRFRRFNRFRAQLGGYFWLPCDICGQWWGGHEWMTDDPRSRIPHSNGSPFSSFGICPDCTRADRGHWWRENVRWPWQMCPNGHPANAGAKFCCWCGASVDDGDTGFRVIYDSAVARR